MGPSHDMRTGSVRSSASHSGLVMGILVSVGQQNSNLAQTVGDLSASCPLLLRSLLPTDEAGQRSASLRLGERLARSHCTSSLRADNVEAHRLVICSRTIVN